MGSKKGLFSAVSHGEAYCPEHSSQPPSPDVHNRPAKMSRKRQSHHLKGDTAVPGAGLAKKRARAIQRLFQKDDASLPENVRVELERELAGLTSTIQDREFQKRRSKMISKYHMVRFFERRKAERLVKRLRARLNEASDPSETRCLEADLRLAEVDVNYTKYHPHLEPYISLYPKGGKDFGDAGKGDARPVASNSSAALALRSERPPIWKEVEQATEEGENALLRLRERRQGPYGSNLRHDRLKSPTDRKHVAGQIKQIIRQSNAGKDGIAMRSAKHKHEGGGENMNGGFFDEDN